MRSHPPCASTGRLPLLLRLGDYAAGVATAVGAATAVHALIGTGSDMVLAMLAGMALGLLSHLLVLGVAGPFVGFFQVMAPGGLIGMYGGALFAMRDSMQAASWSHALGVAVVFGLAVVAAVDLYDRALRPNPTSGAEESRAG